MSSIKEKVYLCCAVCCIISYTSSHAWTMEPKKKQAVNLNLDLSKLHDKGGSDAEEESFADQGGKTNESKTSRPDEGNESLTSRPDFNNAHRGLRPNYHSSLMKEHGVHVIQDKDLVQLSAHHGLNLAAVKEREEQLRQKGLLYHSSEMGSDVSVNIVNVGTINSMLIDLRAEELKLTHGSDSLNRQIDALNLKHNNPDVDQGAASNAREFRQKAIDSLTLDRDNTKKQLSQIQKKIKALSDSLTHAKKEVLKVLGEFGLTEDFLSHLTKTDLQQAKLQ